MTVNAAVWVAAAGACGCVASAAAAVLKARRFRVDAHAVGERPVAAARPSTPGVDPIGSPSPPARAAPVPGWEPLRRIRTEPGSGVWVKKPEEELLSRHADELLVQLLSMDEVAAQVSLELDRTLDEILGAPTSTDVALPKEAEPGRVHLSTRGIRRALDELTLRELAAEALQWSELIRRGEIQGFTPAVARDIERSLHELIPMALEEPHGDARLDVDERLRAFALRMRALHHGDAPATGR